MGSLARVLSFPFVVEGFRHVLACLAGTGLFSIFPGTGCFFLHNQPLEGVVFIG